MSAPTQAIPELRGFLRGLPGVDRVGAEARAATLASRSIKTTAKPACGDARLKVILETGELVTLDNVRRASWLAMLAGADFIKTSTGKVTPAATLPVTLVMLEAVRDFRDSHGRQVGVKSAGGI